MKPTPPEGKQQGERSGEGKHAFIEETKYPDLIIHCSENDAAFEQLEQMWKDHEEELAALDKKWREKVKGLKQIRTVYCKEHTLAFYADCIKCAVAQMENQYVNKFNTAIDTMLEEDHGK